MKTNTWLVIFSTLVFGVGLTVGIITVRIVDASSDPEPAPECPRCDDRDGRRSGGPGRGAGPELGPYITSVRHFADELGLDGAQRKELTGIVDRLTEDVTKQEQAISNRLLATRDEVQSLLTEDQRVALGDLIDQQWEQFRREKVRRQMDWLRSELALAGDDVARIETILTEYEETKGSYFREARHASRWPDRREMEAHLQELSAACDVKLSRYLDEKQLKRFKKSNHHRSGRKPKPPPAAEQ